VRAIAVATALLVATGCQGILGFEATHVDGDGGMPPPPGPLSCAQLDLGVIDLTAPRVGNFEVVNSGDPTGPLAVTLDAGPGVELLRDTCNGQRLARGGTCKIEVQVAPVLAGPSSATVRVGDGGRASVSCTAIALGAAYITINNHGVPGRVLSSPAGISCGNTCEAAFTVPTVALSASMDNPGLLVRWDGPCSGDGPSCDVYMDRNQSPEITFCGFGAWSSTTIVDVDAGRDPALAVTSDGTLHVLHYNSDLGDFRESRRPVGGAWTTGPGFSGPGRNVALAVGPGDSLHATYLRTGGSQDGLWYQHRTATGTWQGEPIELGAGMGEQSDLVVDPQGRVHVVYYDSSRGDMHYAQRAAGGGWRTQLIDSSNDVGRYPSITLDDNTLYIAFYIERDADHLDEISAASADIGSDPMIWAYAPIDTGTSVGAYTDIAVDRDGRLRVAYQDQRNGDLRYAINTPNGNGWIKETPDQSGDVGASSRLVVDSLGGVHIVYLDATSADLKYAYRAPGGAWTITPIEQSGTITGGLGLALGPKGIDVVFRNGNALRAARLPCTTPFDAR